MNKKLLKEKKENINYRNKRTLEDSGNKQL